MLWEGSYFHDPGLEILVGKKGFVLDPGFVGVDGIDGVFQYFGDLFIVGDADPDEGEDAEIGI